MRISTRPTLWAGIVGVNSPYHTLPENVSMVGLCSHSRCAELSLCESNPSQPTLRHQNPLLTLISARFTLPLRLLRAPGRL
jgi:hypothetical protein